MLASLIMKIILCTITVILMVACTSKDEVSVDFPITEECRESSISKLNEITSGVDGFSVSYHAFDYQLDSHPEIKGYLRFVSDSHKSKQELEGYFNAVLFECHHTSRTTTNLKSLSETLEFLEIDEGYINIHSGEATVWYGARNANK